MPKIDSLKFYASAIKKHGTTAKGLNWLSTTHQEIRFQEISKLLPKNLHQFSLGDAGCGFANFYHYLLQKNKKPKHYTGIDSLLDMVKIASSHIPIEILHLDICKENIPTQDYYVCSGALNVLTTFETHLFIQNCYNSSREAFIFNVLYGNKESDTYNYLEKETIEAIAKKLNVKKVVYVEGYLKNDITVKFIKK